MEQTDYKQKAEAFLKENIYTLVVTKDEKFYHGEIVGVNDSYIILNDRYLGKFPILFSEINRLEPSQQERKTEWRK
jgi:hypothetical protein